MMLCVDIRKQLGDFRLEVRFGSSDFPLALLGSSGCGKSVTLKCIAGILTPDEGHIELDGITLYDSASKIDLPPQRRRVGYLFQQYALFPNMTVRQNIAAAVPGRAGRRAAVAEKLRLFRLEEVADQRPAQLSGGQQQRTALARILASEPKAILLDEPFSALDSYLRVQLELELADTLADFSGPVVWVSHDRGEVFRNCRQVCVLDRGRSQPVQATGALFRAPSTEAAARLFGCENFFDAQPREQSVFLPALGLTLFCGRPVPDAVRRVAIRARSIRLAGPDTENRLLCRVLRTIEDVNGTVVLLQPEGAPPDCPLLRMESGKAGWGDGLSGRPLAVDIPPEDILLLES